MFESMSSHLYVLDYTTIKFFLLQIRQYRRLEDGSLNVVTRGQQRFRLRRRWIDVEGAVRIILCLRDCLFITLLCCLVIYIVNNFL